MKMNDYTLMSNNELRILMEELNCEYEAIKVKVKEYISKMEGLNDSYLKIQEIYLKRTKGRM